MRLLHSTTSQVTLLIVGAVAVRAVVVDIDTATVVADDHLVTGHLIEDDLMTGLIATLHRNITHGFPPSSNLDRRHFSSSHIRITGLSAPAAVAAGRDPDRGRWGARAVAVPEDRDEDDSDLAYDYLLERLVGTSTVVECVPIFTQLKPKRDGILRESMCTPILHIHFRCSILCSHHESLLPNTWGEN